MRRRQQTKRQPSRETWWSRPAGLLPLSRASAAERAADAIRRSIQSGDVRPGQGLESSRMLARELGVSLPVVREAMAALQAIGLVEVRHGVGAFVSRRPRAARVLKVANRRATRRELDELRSGLEGVIAATATRRGTPHKLREVRFALGERRLASRSGNPDTFTDADFEFHQRVAQAAGNVLAMSLHRLACVGLRSHLRARARRLASDQRLDGLHAALVDAIEAGRQASAARAAAAIAWIEAEAQPP
ncbi:MAG TPA: GntR family transcriptional regulator [Candidatus Limnocylindria bacterium]